ncbi:hypothetical protein [Piscinibacter sakaiensis]|uniref:hypothetical protein n=1 Tax=Piscinibacter sakaiensis TaxID=1547922 RepID=UPI003AAFB95C
MATDLITQLKEYDEAREGIPGEHWMVLAAGLGVWYWSAKHPSAIVKLLGVAAATALIGRAASGRDGLTKLFRYTPVGGALRHAPAHRQARQPSDGASERLHQHRQEDHQRARPDLQ